MPLLGPTSSGKMYQSIIKHRDSNPSEAQWLSTISPQDEYALFDTADQSQWLDASGDYWSLRIDRKVLGAEGERISKHPNPSNILVPWHGYPASPARRGGGDKPARTIIEAWLSAQLINRSFAKRLKKAQL
jgi:hypothetical protein